MSFLYCKQCPPLLGDEFLMVFSGVNVAIELPVLGIEL